LTVGGTFFRWLDRGDSLEAQLIREGQMEALSPKPGAETAGALARPPASAGLIAALVNPTNPNAESDSKGLLAAAQSMGMTINVLHASSERDIDAFFSTLVLRRASAFLTTSDPLFTGRRQQLAVLAAFHKIPAMYVSRDNTDAGGLMSYAPNIKDVFRQAGVYTGRILKGEKPADLPVMQPTKFELIINLKTAKALGLTIPETLLATADEVIQ
jgi:putative tryptophan/tyrosine transport system substrate-binding protein